MESLQQATDGEGAEETNTRRYQESNITLRRYTEDKQVQETEPKRLVRGSLFVKEVIYTTVCCIT